jgi:hypothetical protein
MKMEAVIMKILTILSCLLTLILLVLVLSACNNSRTTGTTTTSKTSTVTGTPETKYAITYDDTAHGGSYAYALAVDNSGNAYVTGITQLNSPNEIPAFLTIKYDNKGKQLWKAVYEGPANGFIGSLAVDNAGNVYVTGSSIGASAGSGITTLKYDTDGNQLWVATYNGTGNSDDYAVSVAADSTGVYVIGGSSVTDSKQDFLTIKYDFNGNKIWEARYNSPENGDDFARALTIDKSGNVYIVGNGNSTSGATGGNTYATTTTNHPGKGKGYYTTLKYDSNGQQLWAAQYKGAGDNDDLARAIRVDDSGNVYITGESAGISGAYEYATVKYDAGGKQLWAKSYTGAGGNSGAYAMSLDASANIIVTGYSSGTSAREYATVKYDNNGNQLWAARYSGPYGDNAPCSIATDSTGNVYVTGTSGFIKYDSTAYRNYATVKYDKEGNQLWAVRYGGQKGSHSMAQAMALDTAGNIYVTGINYQEDSQYYTITTVKYIQ